MKRKSLPVGLVAVLAVAAMGVLGVAYALWSSTVTIGGTVSTATFDPEAGFVTTATGGANCAPSSGQQNLPQTFNLNSTNLVPGQGCSYLITVTNNSTIPVNVAVSGPGAPASPHAEVLISDNCAGLPATLAANGGNASCTISIQFTDTFPAPNTFFGPFSAAISQTITVSQ